MICAENPAAFARACARLEKDLRTNIGKKSAEARQITDGLGIGG